PRGPDGAQRNPGLVPLRRERPRISLRSIRATFFAFNSRTIRQTIRPVAAAAGVVVVVVAEPVAAAAGIAVAAALPAGAARPASAAADASAQAAARPPSVDRAAR